MRGRQIRADRVLGHVNGRSTFRGRPIPVTGRDQGGEPNASGPAPPSPDLQRLRAVARRKIETHVRTAPGQGLNAVERLRNGAFGVLGLANGERDGGRRQRMRHSSVVGPVGHTTILPPMRLL
jgi:hypothetical protein